MKKHPKIEDTSVPVKLKNMGSFFNTQIFLDVSILKQNGSYEKRYTIGEIVNVRSQKIDKITICFMKRRD